MSDSELAQAEANFEGRWEDDEGTVVTVQDRIILGPDGMNIPVQYLSVEECRFESDDVEYLGKLDAAGNIQWQDGSVWFPKDVGHRGTKAQASAGLDEEKARRAAALERIRAAKAAAAEAQMPSMERQAGEEDKARKAAILERARARAAGARQAGAPSEAEPDQAGSPEEDAPARFEDGMDLARQAFEESRKSAALERARANIAANRARMAEAATTDEAGATGDAGMDRAKQAFEEERARRAAALERARANAAAAKNAGGLDRGGAGAISETGVSRARQAFEEEKARRAAALERARANTAQARDTDSGLQATNYMDEAKAKSDFGIDRARKGFEEEQARKAAAMERAKAVKANCDSMDRARQAFEEEKARKAAAIERARARVAEAAAAGGGSSGSPSRDSGDARARSSMDKARQAFEAEKARKAAALERARAKAAQAAQVEAGSGRAAGERTGGFGRLPGRASGTGGGGFGGGNGGRVGFGAQGGFGGRPAGGGGRFGRGYAGVDEPIQFGPGTFVRLVGLKARPELNKWVGMLISFDEKKGRWQVRLAGRDDMLLKEDNLVALSQQEYDDLKGFKEMDEIKAEQEVQAIHTRASGGKMRWCDEREGAIERGPGDEGNEIDVFMTEESDGLGAAEKIADCLKERGVCLCEANAPHQLLSEAWAEADDLWENGAFGPPMRIFDEGGQMEAQVWKDILYQDEAKVFWINPEEPQPRIAERTRSLKALSENMLEFCRGLGEPMLRKTGIKFTHLWNAMLSCYCGDRTYSVHLDNPHACGQERNLPDNGLRLTLCYYINVHWNPIEEYNGGGMDVYLTDARTSPQSAASARQAPRMRIAPHADTLAVFLSERMAHQVIQTKGRERLYCLTVWCFETDVMNQFMSRLMQMRGMSYQPCADAQDDSDSDLG